VIITPLGRDVVPLVPLIVQQVELAISGFTKSVDASPTSASWSSSRFPQRHEMADARAAGPERVDALR
jgi:hypothetical protein